MWRGGPRSKRAATIDGPIIPSRAQVSASGGVAVTEDSMLRHSAVWACLRLRADLVSTLPLDSFRYVSGIQIEVPKPPVLIDPGGKAWPMTHWMWASQLDLDRTGNAVGLITERNALNLPIRIDLQDIRRCSIVERKGEPVRYRINGTLYDEENVWHERQFPVAGIRAGLSPLAYAAWTIGAGLSLQQFAVEWFSNGAVPLAHLKNARKELKPGEADVIKDRFKASIQDHDIWVTGSEWEYDFIQAQTAGLEWLEGSKANVTDVSRFFGCPADLIDAAVSGQSVTYANITQRNLQFLIMQLNPAVTRRELALSTTLPRPRFVKLNRDAMLAMDPETRARVISAKIADRTMTNSEARRLENKPALTQTDIDEFAAIYGAPRVQPTTATASAGGS